MAAIPQIVQHVECIDRIAWRYGLAVEGGLSGLRPC